MASTLKTERVPIRTFGTKIPVTTERGKHQDNGVQEAEFNPYSWRYAWTEGNSWHYRTPAPFDMKAMTKLYGSRQELESIVDEVLMASSDFDTGGYGHEIHEMTEAKSIGDLGFGQFAIGNQPIQHMLHMYNFTNAPHKAQYWVKKSLNELLALDS